MPRELGRDIRGPRPLAGEPDQQLGGREDEESPDHQRDDSP
jgi:hypothetical protein